MEEFFEVLEGKSVLTIEEYILSEGSNENGIHQRHFKPKEKVIGCNTDNFFNKIGSYLNMDVSDKFGFVVMMNTNDEVFVRASEEQYYTLLFGYKPNTKLQIVQKVNDIAKIDVIEFTKGDLIILNNSVEYTYGSATYTENKIFEVIYMFFNSKP